MSAKTMREQYELGLLKLGYKKVPSRSRKYWEYEQEGKANVFLGKAGAVRLGRVVTKSTAATPGQKRIILRAADDSKLKGEK